MVREVNFDTSWKEGWVGMWFIVRDHASYVLITVRFQANSILEVEVKVACEGILIAVQQLKFSSIWLEGESTIEWVKKHCKALIAKAP